MYISPLIEMKYFDHLHAEYPWHFPCYVAEYFLFWELVSKNPFLQMIQVDKCPNTLFISFSQRT